ncbi:class III lanthipeptide [Kitasatospora cineracea]
MTKILDLQKLDSAETELHEPALSITSCDSQSCTH